MRYPWCGPQQETRDLYFVREFFQFVLDLAPFLDWKSPRQFFVYPLRGSLIGRSCNTNRQCPHHRARSIERSHRSLKTGLLTTLTSAKQVILRNAAILEDQFSSLRSPQTHLLFDAPNNQAGRPLGDDKRANALSTQAFIDHGKCHN